LEQTSFKSSEFETSSAVKAAPKNDFELSAAMESLAKKIRPRS
jgi:hypothetical protein